jgi:hypothetical protein
VAGTTLARPWQIDREVERFEVVEHDEVAGFIKTP